MENVIQINTEDDMALTIKSRGIRNAIGKALGSAYATMPWMVDVDIRGGIAKIICPAITDKYCMVIHLKNKEISDLETQAVRMGGELLERFNINRTTGFIGDMMVDISGQAIGAAKGEQ